MSKIKIIKNKKLYLREVFDRPLKGSWQKKTNDMWLGIFKVGNFEYTLEIKNIGKIGKLFITKYNLPDAFWNQKTSERSDVWTIAFYISKTKEHVKTYITNTLKNPDYVKSLQTFSTVYNAIRDWARQVKPDIFIIESKQHEPSRIKLLDRLMKKMAKDTEFVLSKRDKIEERYRYIVINKKFVGKKSTEDNISDLFN